MELTSQDNIIVVKGQPKTLSEIGELSSAISGLVNLGEKQIRLQLIEVITIPSSLLGIIAKYVNAKNVDFTLECSEASLRMLLESMKLHELFTIKAL